MKIRLLQMEYSSYKPGHSWPILEKLKILMLMIFSLVSASLFAQQRVTGRVIAGESGVSGATVQVKETNAAAVTDSSGNFSINATPGATIVITHINYVSQEAKVTSSGKVNVQLQPTVAQSMLEVVVVGYGTQKRSDVTGSVASVPKNRFSQLPVTNVMQAIQGAVAGVNVSVNSPVPGRTASLQVRGMNSITANNSPLIVLDGVPLPDDASTNDINANDIASMEILKDASAVAIYGVRGSNGVILITTKRGTTGKPIIRYNVYSGIENIIETLNPSSPERYVKKWADYKKQNGLSDTSILNNLYERNNYYAGKTTDWVDAVTQQGVLTDHNLSISGGTKDAKYYISGEYLNQKGAVKGYQYKRINLRSNLDVNITDWLSAGTSFFYNNNNSDGGRANFYLAHTMSPYGSLYDANGQYTLYPMYPELLYLNPLLGLTTDRLERSNNLTGTGYAEIKPGFIKGLKYRMNASYSLLTSRNGTYEGRSVNNQLGSATTQNTEAKNWIIENILSYTKDWNEHHVDFTGLYSAQEKVYYKNNSSASGFINDYSSFYNLSAGATQTAGSYQDGSNKLSQMGRINYSYDSRYLFTVTARRDGASVFGANTTKYGVFPSVALGWNLHNEKFMSGFEKINSLKLRASYGKTGNEAISINGTQTTAGTNRIPFNGVTTIGVLASNLGNADLHWESTKGLNIGVDFSIYNNRISGTIDAFRTNTEDLLLKRNIPNITGYSNILDNLGKTKNKGIEVTLNTVNIPGNKFRWESNLNFASYRNEIASLYGNIDPVTGKEVDDISNGWFIGQPVRVIYDYTMEGVWQKGEDPSAVDKTAKPGHLKFKDINGDKLIDDKDKSVLGSRLPKWTGGLTNTFHYKNFHLNIFIQTSQGALRNNVNLTFADEGWRINIPSEINYWTEENPINDRPSLSDQARAGARGYAYPKDASYTRIKDVTLSYTMPQSILDKIKLGSLTLYASGRNLYTFTDWQGWDPEQDFTFRGSGDWVNNYPPVRSIVFGANITLR
ncbi:TonB-dependent receptor [Chitinophagaceae bacterium LB-8]|uniref:TonB-dependent receptor n=1 Tax=Paraflavisolibacter caeni TaxID=2982496 RepID=A0A9X2XW71_9BACT|nr:TonB-dependent receptor [Paraflavisolibacter caeni]MCU7550185.1 TonB-dependent receptor [Paraflavisolibacter caeni]